MSDTVLSYTIKLLQTEFPADEGGDARLELRLENYSGKFDALIEAINQSLARDEPLEMSLAGGALGKWEVENVTIGRVPT